LRKRGLSAQLTEGPFGKSSWGGRNHGGEKEEDLWFSILKLAEEKREKKETRLRCSTTVWDIGLATSM